MLDDVSGQLCFKCCCTRALLEKRVEIPRAHGWRLILSAHMAASCCRKLWPDRHAPSDGLGPRSPVVSPLRHEPPMTSAQAILAIRHLVQDHGDEGTRLGNSALCDGIRLVWRAPRMDLATVVSAGDRQAMTGVDGPGRLGPSGFLESVESFLLRHGGLA